MRQLPRLAALALLCFGAPAFAADHLDSPSVREDGSTDILDFYAYVTPGDADKLTLIMTVSPFAAGDATFSDAADYTFWLATEGEAVYAINCWFTGDSFTCDAGNGISATGNLDARADGDSISAWAGMRDDPFFFDLGAFNNAVGADDMANPFCLLDPEAGGNGDTFAGQNVNAIVVEVRHEVFLDGEETGQLAIWATTSQRGG